MLFNIIHIDQKKNDKRKAKLTLLDCTQSGDCHCRDVSERLDRHRR
jgi:hypothetical protein